MGRHCGLQPRLAAPRVRAPPRRNPLGGRRRSRSTASPIAFRVHHAASACGAERYPWLADLVPPRPPYALPCATCGGRGKLRPATSPNERGIFCPQCYTRGWAGRRRTPARDRYALARVPCPPDVYRTIVRLERRLAPTWTHPPAATQPRTRTRSPHPSPDPVTPTRGAAHDPLTGRSSRRSGRLWSCRCRRPRSRSR
jgi:hypothetical protein